MLCEADVISRQYHYDAEALQAFRRDRFIDTATFADAIALTPFVLYADENGYSESASLHQNLTDRRWARKEFQLDRPAARRAEVYFTMSSPDTHVLFNGTPVPITDAKKWAYSGWAVVNVPVDLLKPGRNTVDLSHAATLAIVPCAQPNRSARSIDGGQTWDYDHLGNDGEFNGEYIVRLGLGQYAAVGVLWSDELAIASLAGSGPIMPTIETRSVMLAAERDTPAETTIDYEVRTGPVPSYDPNQWDAWRPASMDRPLDVPADHHYVQWRAFLRTDDPLVTPKLHSISLTAKFNTVTRPANDTTRVTRFDNQKIVRSSYVYHYQKPSPRLDTLREKYRINEIAAGEDDLQRLVALRDWTRGMWSDGWVDGEYSLCAPMDALLIFDLAPENKVSAFCGHYGGVFSQCAQSLGYNGRVVCGRGHAYAEVWSDDFQKWILMDVGPAVDDVAQLNYHYEHDGIPLNSLELHQRLLADDWDGVEVVTSDPKNRWTIAEFPDRMKRYEYVRLLPRNNQLDTWFPGTVNVKGWAAEFDWITWRDGAVSEKRRDEFSATNRPDDLYWTINQVAIYPYQTDAPDTLRLEFDTHTPNFATYQVRIDDGDWSDCDGSVDWDLLAGHNRIEARIVNAFGRPGIVSRLEVQHAK
ncbi:MAG: hypothetical protein CMJ49_09985 [Planctomycetaceae bacterium]|nr:hypothetical protein [Planctomycetaceae bacterium]